MKFSTLINRIQCLGEIRIFGESRDGFLYDMYFPEDPGLLNTDQGQIIPFITSFILFNTI